MCKLTRFLPKPSTGKIMFYTYFVNSVEGLIYTKCKLNLPAIDILCKNLHTMLACKQSVTERTVYEDKNIYIVCKLNTM